MGKQTACWADQRRRHVATSEGASCVWSSIRVIAERWVDRECLSELDSVFDLDFLRVSRSVSNNSFW
jgi:hypothetical protein